MDKPTFVYVTYIATTLEQLWEALTERPFTQQYWEDGHIQSDWQTGSPVQHVSQDGESVSVGEVLESEPPYRLSYTVYSSHNHSRYSTDTDSTEADSTEAEPSRVRFQLEQHGDTVKLTLIHHQIDTQSCMAMSHQWTTRLTHLKHLLELEDVVALVA